MTFFVVRGSEDGTQIHAFESQAEVSEFLKECGLDEFHSEPSDTNYWDENACMVISGKVVIPKAKEMVTEWDVG